jgi:pilus assembly protein CpaD
MLERRLAALALVSALALAGCDISPEPNPWTQGESPHPVHVDHLRMKFVADFAPGSSELASGVAARLDTFLDQSAIRANDRVYIEAPADGRLVAARIGQLVKRLDRRGLGAQTLPSSAAAGADQLTMLVDRYVVTLPDCPNWSLPPNDDHGNQPAPNFGCANATNFGLMIDDPRDLVVGRVPGPAEAEPGINAIHRYRTDRVKWSNGAPASQAAAAGSSGGGAGGGSPSPSPAPAPAGQ